MPFAPLMLLCASLFAAAQAAAETAVIELADGSELRGQVLSLKDNAYRIQTESLGTISVPQDRVALVRYPKGAARSSAAAAPAVPPVARVPSAPGSTSRNTDLNATVSALMGRLSADPAALKEITALAADPQLKSLLEDPAVRSAISNEDYASLAEHPKVRALMSHPAIRKLSSQLK